MATSIESVLARRALARVEPNRHPGERAGDINFAPLAEPVLRVAHGRRAMCRHPALSGPEFEHGLPLERSAPCKRRVLHIAPSRGPSLPTEPPQVVRCKRADAGARRRESVAMLPVPRAAATSPSVPDASEGLLIATPMPIGTAAASERVKHGSGLRRRAGRPLRRAGHPDAQSAEVERAREWSPEVEDAFRLAEAGYRNLDHLAVLCGGEPERWPNGFIKKLRCAASLGRPASYLYFPSRRECSDAVLHTVKLYRHRAETAEDCSQG